MKLFKRIWAFILVAVLVISMLPATLTQAALYEGLQWQGEDLVYVKENPSVEMGEVEVHSVNSAGKASDYTTTYTVEEGNVIVLDALTPSMNQPRDWIGAAESKFIITDNYQVEKTQTYNGHESAYLEGETPIEPLVSEAEGVDHTATLAEDAKEVVPGTYTYLENGKPTYWTIVLHELVEPSGDDNYTIVTSKNGFVEFEGVKYLVVNGYVDFTANGLYEDPEDGAKTKPKYMVIDGVMHSDGLEIFEFEGVSYYLSYGKFNESFTGFVPYDGVIYYVVKGIVSTETTGVVENLAAPGSYYYVVDGVVDTTWNETVPGNDGETFEFTDGICVKSTETPHVVITCSDRHDKTDNLQNILKAMPAEPAPEAAIHNGDAVESGTFKFADITAEFAEIFPELDGKVFYSYGSHDSAAEEYDNIEPDGVMYETDDYIFYDISMNTMQNAEKAAEGAAAFTEAAADFDTSKVLFIASHMPLHTRRGDNLGAATWFDAINAVAKNMDTIVLWSHNHTGETNADTQNYLRMPGESMTPQGGSKKKAEFMYANAGYIIVGYMTQWTITDSTITIQRYDDAGAVDFHDGVTYPVVFNRKADALVAGDINHNEAGDGESTGGGGGGGGFDNVESYITASEIAAAKLEANAGPGAYVFAEEKNSSTIFTWTITLNEDGTYDVEEVRGSFGTSYFTGESWSAEGTFVTLGPNSADSRKGGWFDPAGLYMIVYPETMTFLPSLTAEGLPDAETKTGWVQEDGKWFYYDEDGNMTTGWQKVENAWYYLGEDGSMTTGWQKVDNLWYYFNPGGSMVTGWKQINNVWYYFNAGGSMVTGWKKIDNVWYYFNTGGSMATGWKKIDNVWYYFNTGGSMVTGWKKIDNVWYYFKTSGAMATGWKQINNVWYYFKTSGAMATGWLQLGDNWYYFQSNGVMVTGIVVINGRSNSFSDDGVWLGYAD